MCHKGFYFISNDARCSAHTMVYHTRKRIMAKVVTRPRFWA